MLAYLILACTAEPALGDAERIDDGSGSAQNPCLSADGDTLLWTRFEGGYGAGQSALVRATEYGLDPTVVATDARNTSGRCQSPAGDTAVYTDSATEVDAVWVVDLAGSSQAPLSDEAEGASDPAYTAQGDAVVYTSGGQLWARALDGSAPEALTDAGFSDTRAAPANTGDAVVFESDRGGGAGLWMVTPGGEATVFLDTPAAEEMPTYDLRQGGVVFAMDDCKGYRCIAWTDGDTVDVLVEADGWTLGSPFLGSDGTLYFEGAEGAPGAAAAGIYRKP